jgi:hypothetical protein
MSEFHDVRAQIITVAARDETLVFYWPPKHATEDYIPAVSENLCHVDFYGSGFDKHVADSCMSNGGWDVGQEVGTFLGTGYIEEIEVVGRVPYDAHWDAWPEHA